MQMAPMVWQHQCRRLLVGHGAGVWLEQAGIISMRLRKVLRVQPDFLAEHTLQMEMQVGMEKADMCRDMGRVIRLVADMRIHMQDRKVNLGVRMIYLMDLNQAIGASCCIQEGV
jgi:hypothetical protein